MAGAPKLRAVRAAVENAGGADAVLERIANGATIKQLALEFGVCRSALSRWCNTDSRQDAYTRARTEAAMLHAETGLALTDGATPETVHVARVQSDYRKYLAAKLDPANWSKAHGESHSVDLGRLHLEAVKALSAGGR